MKVRAVLETATQRELRYKTIYEKHRIEPAFDSFVLLPKEIRLLNKMTKKPIELKDKNKNACLVESLLNYDLVRPTNEFEYLEGREPYLRFTVSNHGYRWLRSRNLYNREARIALILSILSLLGSILDIFYD